MQMVEVIELVTEVETNYYKLLLPCRLRKAPREAEPKSEAEP